LTASVWNGAVMRILIIEDQLPCRSTESPEQLRRFIERIEPVRPHLPDRAASSTANPSAIATGEMTGPNPS
jgi:hypothetical protein